VVYPLSLRMEGRRAVVVGGGAVAVRRVAGLRAAGADVLVVSPRLSPALADLAARGLIGARNRGYAPADLDGAWLVLACTDRPEVNAAVAADAEARRLWCVRADDAAASAAWVPAVGRAGGVTVAVNAGRDPRRAALLRDRFVDAVSEGPDGGPDDGPARAGRVSIVGGGPGDPGLITVAGLERLRAADVVVADRLAPLELLDTLPGDTEIVDAAKVPGGPAMRQERINQVLIEAARAGRAVVRLKGGDPFVFGRGREEVDACRAAGVAVEVLPGLTSAIAVPAAAGIPVTHRGLSRGFCVVTGHADSHDWAALAHSGLTLVLLMAVERLAGTAGALLAAGMAGHMPSACIADGWTPRQRTVTAPLRDIAAAVSAGHITNPAVVVIGDVARFAEPEPGAEPPAPLPRRILVLGGARSGKSAAAERMLAGHPSVDYIATGAPLGTGDEEWDARVEAHRKRRPAHWRTVETLALGEVLSVPAPPALIDCLTTWLARVMDETGAWGGGTAPVDQLIADWRGASRHVIAVSNEVGSGIVPATAAGRRFRDELGRLNAAIAAASDEVWLCTAGIARRLR
jgi:uroporphyrin-III C-methyltransferase / precorrin-2 dehydrogenase / sirohydrochlorin ferrochelatase